MMLLAQAVVVVMAGSMLIAIWTIGISVVRTFRGDIATLIVCLAVGTALTLALIGWAIIGVNSVVPMSFR